MASIPTIVSRIKSHLDEHLSDAQIHQACADAQHIWRQRTLDPVTLLRLFMIQILHGNVACRALRHLGEMDATVTAYCNARKRLPLKVFAALTKAACVSMCHVTADIGKWRSHRVWLIDGSSTSLPDVPSLQHKFGKPTAMKPGCGFPVAHVLMLMDVHTGFVGEMLVNTWSASDMAQASATHASMQEGDVLVGDRAFGSYAHFALLLQRKLHGVCRMNQSRLPATSRKSKKRRRRAPRQSPMMRSVRDLGRDDLLVELIRDRPKPTWMDSNDWDQLLERITLRQITYRVPQDGYRTRKVTLLTTLTDAKAYPLKELAKLYHARWEIETNFRYLKTTLGMDTLHCKSPDGVMKELWMYVLVYNRVRRVMLDEARRLGVKPSRVSFIDALDAIRYGGGRHGVALIVNPDRPGRMEPRVIKRPKDRYRYMTRPREQLRQELLDKQKELAA